MKTIRPSKVFVQYRDRMAPYDPVDDRKYTITHSDTTAQLFVTIGDDYAEDQINKTRDEVRLEWTHNIKGRFLMGSVLIDGEGVHGNAALRNKIFLKDMPMALEALRHADRFLFERHPNLDSAPVYIRFISKNPSFNKTYDFGTIGSYK